MNRSEAMIVADLWRVWSEGREVNNRARREFVFEVVLSRARFSHLNCFEVLDAVTNQGAWAVFGRPTASGVTRLDAGKTAEHRTRREPRAAGVVEVKQAAY